MRYGVLILVCIAGLALPMSATAGASGDAVAKQAIRKHILKMRSFSDRFALCTPDSQYCGGNIGYRIAAYVRDTRPQVAALLRLQLSARVKSGVHYYLAALTAYQVGGAGYYTASRTKNVGLLTAATRQMLRASNLSNRAIRLIYS